MITKDFETAVRSGELPLVRIMLKDSLLIDPTAERFKEMECYAAAKMSRLYDEHDGEKLNFDRNFWNKQYFNQQMVAVIQNFSKERIELLQNMALYLYEDKANKIRQDRAADTSRRSDTRKQAGTGAMIAGTAIAVAGICAFETVKTALIVGGAVVAAAGAALIISERRDA